MWEKIGKVNLSKRCVNRGFVEARDKVDVVEENIVGF